MRRALVAAFLAGATVVTAQEAPPAARGWVVLSVDEYRTLRRTAQPPDVEPAGPPVEAALTRLDYDLRVAGDTAVGSARLTVDVLKEGWVRVPIPPGLRVGAARVDGRPIAVVHGEAKAKAPQVLLSHRGRSVLALDIAVPVASNAGTESLALPPGGTAVTRATVVVPRDGVDVALTGALLAEKDDGNRQSRWVAYGDGASPITFSWRRRVEDRRTGLPLRFRGTLIEHVGFGEESAQLTADVRLDVVQGAATNVVLSLPEGVAVNRVAGKNVADWEARDGRLTISFLDAVESTETLVVSGEARCPREGHVSVPLLRLPAAERETGGVAVEVAGAGIVRDAAPRGMDAAEPETLEADTAGREWGLVTVFRFRPQDGQAPRDLAVTLERYNPQAVLLAAVDEARYQVLLSDAGETLVQARYAVRNNTQSFLVVTLPPAAELWSAAVGGRPVRPGRSAEGAFLLPLEKAKAGEEAPPFLVELVYVARGARWTTEGRSALALPSLDLPTARTGVMLHHPPGHRLALEPGAFREQPYRRPSSGAFAAARASAPSTPTPAAAGPANAEHGALQGLVERVQKANGLSRGVAGAPPIQAPFPAYGSFVFLASELTREREAPVIDVRYKKMKGGRR